MKKKILFRADGNSTTGLGHLYRLFSLVETVKTTFEFVFLTSESSTLEVIPKNYKVITIPENIEIEYQPEWISQNFSAEEYVIIADGYHFNSDYQKTLKDKNFKLIYIDDLVSGHIFADLVINHSPQVESLSYNAEFYTQFALGTNYALLRPLFLKEASRHKTYNKTDIAFVCFGGADSFDLCFKYAKSLISLKKFKKIHIVIGAAYKQNSVYNLKDAYPELIEIHLNLSEESLLNVMKNCSFAVVPTSTILFEIFCVKMPVYSGYFVDNQKEAYIAFKEKNVVGGNGNMVIENQETMTSNLKKFIDDMEPNKIMLMQEQIIDGSQSKRHLEIINRIANA